MEILCFYPPSRFKLILVYNTAKSLLCFELSDVSKIKMKAVAEEALKEFYIFTDSVWTDIFILVLFKVSSRKLSYLNENQHILSREPIYSGTNEQKTERTNNNNM